MSNGRTPAPVDQDGALDFQDRPAQPSNSAVIHVAFQGVPVDLHVHDKKIGQVEELIAGLLKRGWQAPPRSGGFGPRKDDHVKPHYNDAGDPCCPTHQKSLRQFTTQDGRTFWSCPARGDEGKGEKVNKNGYCAIKFDL